MYRANCLCPIKLTPLGVTKVMHTNGKPNNLNRMKQAPDGVVPTEPLVQEGNRTDTHDQGRPINDVKLRVELEVQKHRAQTKGLWAETQQKLSFQKERMGTLGRKLKSIGYERLWTKPTINDPERREPMTLADWFILIATVLTFVTLLGIENTAGANQLLHLGAFGIESIWHARGLLLVPAIVGLALAEASVLLPTVWVSRIHVAATVGLLISGVVYCLAMAHQAGIFSGMGGLNLDQEPVNTGGLSGWLMFSTSLLCLGLTAFVFHAALHKQNERRIITLENPAFLNLVAEEHSIEAEINSLNESISSLKAVISRLKAEEAVVRSQARFS